MIESLATLVGLFVGLTTLTAIRSSIRISKIEDRIQVLEARRDHH